VEEEVNGIFTFDRKIAKIDETKIRESNRNMYLAFSKAIQK
jgi:hypothetical protein